ALKVEDPGPLDGGYDRKPPANGLIVNVYTRALDRADLREPDAGPIAGIDAGPLGVKPSAVCKTGGGAEAARDHLWLTEAEWRSLVPRDAKAGMTFPLPPVIARR